MRISKPFSWPAAVLLAAAAGSTCSTAARAQTVFYSENFDGAVLNQPSGDPRVTAACVSNVPAFTHTPPDGWDWRGCGVSSYNCRVMRCDPVPGFRCSTCGNNEGVFEWEGWSFASKSFWGVATDDQGRRLFTLGTGNVAVADSDEWDDRGNPDNNCGYYSAFMKTQPIAIDAADPASLAFMLDSSWQYEGFDDGPNATNNQTALIRAYYTVGGVEQAAVDVLHWDSDDGVNSGSGAPSPFFHDDNVNEVVVITSDQLQVPVGASSVRFEFGLTNAGNDWWWAIDNLVFMGDVAGSPSTLFSENFDSLVLQPPVHEVPSGCGITYCGVNTHTHDGPGGVSVAVDSPDSGGVPDWRGWSFVDRPFWVCASGGPNGSAFANSNGKVAVADGDEFDDLAHAPGVLDTTLSTPMIDLTGRLGNVVVASFDSSWRYEAGQTATIEVRFNDPAQTVGEVLRWESIESSSYFKADAVNERVVLPLQVPAGATAASLHFRYVGGNNWWWAIDNLSVFEGVAVVNVASSTPNQGPMALAPSVDYAPCATPWSLTAPVGWTQFFDPIGACPSECGRPEWRGWAFAFKDWWWQQVDDQLRQEFTLGRGFVAIADPDEWDDFANGRSSFNAFMATPAIALPGTITSATLEFDSSWRYEGFDDGCSCDPEGMTNRNNQTATIKAYYTVGGTEQPPVDVLRWDSDDGSNSGTGIPSPYFKPDNTNEAVAIDRAALQIPAGATAARFEFGLTNARNDWWWAVDNIALDLNGARAFAEDFEDVPNLSAPPSENPPVGQCAYFSSVAAQGGNLVADNAGLTNCNPGDDFYGFNAWVVDAWARELGGARTEHLAPTAYISDLAARGCDGTAVLNTPAYGIGALNADTLTLTFRSGWLSEANHASAVAVSFDGGPFSTVLSWNPGNKSTATDEIVTVALNNPEGSSTVRLRFADAESGWWAISEISLSGTVGTDPCPPCAADFNADGGVDGADVESFFLAWEQGIACGDVNLDGGVDGADVEGFFVVWEAGGC